MRWISLQRALDHHRCELCRWVNTNIILMMHLNGNHTFCRKDPDHFGVIVGEIKLTQLEPNEQRKAIGAVISHPEYQPSNGLNDIALLQVYEIILSAFLKIFFTYFLLLRPTADLSLMSTSEASPSTQLIRTFPTRCSWDLARCFQANKCLLKYLATLDARRK